MSKIENTTIRIDQLYKEMGLDDEINYVLTKAENEDFIQRSKSVMYAGISEEGEVIQSKEPRLGLCLIMSPFNKYFTWRTTPITKIIKHEGEILEFKTGNSHYILTGEVLTKNGVKVK